MRVILPVGIYRQGTGVRVRGIVGVTGGQGRLQAGGPAWRVPGVTPIDSSA